MTVSTTTSKVSYSGNGSTTAFAVGFYFLATSHLKVVLRAADGTETVKTLTTDYTVSGAGNPSGGTVTMVTAPASGVTVVIARNVPQTQLVDYQPNDPFPANTHEQALDQLTMEVQQLQEQITRALKLSLTNTMNSTEFTVDATTRALKVLGFDAAGELVVTQELGTYKGNWATGSAYKQRDLIKDTSNNNIYLCLTAHTSSGAQPISTNTDSAKWGLIVDAAAAATSASAAATSATAAATSATAAATSATNAATSASGASTSASTATTQASNASSSASAASTSATNAATSATNAATSATSASSSAAAAAASAASGLYSAVQDKSANYTVVAGDAGDLLRVSTGSGAVTITLPAISTVSDGFKIAIVKWTGDTNTVTIARSGSDTINGATTATIGSQYTQTTFVADFETNQWFAASSGLGSTNVLVDVFSGNGSTTAFTLSGDPGAKNNTAVHIGGVYQGKSTYTVSGTTLTFSSAPPSGTNNVEVVWTQPLAIGVPSDGTVTYAKMQNVTAGKVLGRDTSGAGVAQELPIQVDTYGNIGVGVTPNTSGANPKSIEFSYGAFVSYGGTEFNFATNAYINATSWKYKTTAPAALYQQSNGQHSWQVAGSGTAGASASFTTGMSMDNSGRVTTPAQPRFLVGSSLGDTTVSSGAVVPFDTASYLNVGSGYSTSTNLFTAPVAGRYMFSFTGYFSNSAGNTQTMQIAPYVNGSNVLVGGDAIIFAQCIPNSLGGTLAISGTVILNLAANDTVGCYARGTAARLYMGHTKFSGALLG